MGNPDPILVLTRPEIVCSQCISTLCVHRVAMMWVTIPSCVWCQPLFCVSAVQQQHGWPACSSPHPPGGTETRLTHAKELMSVDSLFWAEQNTVQFCYSMYGYGHWRLYFCDFYEQIFVQLNMIQQKFFYHFTQNQMHILVISISCIDEYYPKLAKIPLSCHFIKKLPFHNVLKTLNNFTVQNWENTLLYICCITKLYNSYTVVYM